MRCRQTGKRLMAKCRMLLQENDELGINISSGRTAKLEGEVALEKKFVEEMKVSQAGARSITSPCTLMLSCWYFWGYYYIINNCCSYLCHCKYRSVCSYQ